MQELVRISSRLGIDPKHDVDLAWVVNEYLSSPLPGRTPVAPLHFDM